MTTVADINNWINSIAPYDTMEEWDNSGFLVGDMQAPVRRCVLSLDATPGSGGLYRGYGGRAALDPSSADFSRTEAGLYRYAGQRIGGKTALRLLAPTLVLTRHPAVLAIVWLLCLGLRT